MITIVTLDNEGDLCYNVHTALVVQEVICRRTIIVTTACHVLVFIPYGRNAQTML
jgi:hypothetical protein